jgi:hypothetical protein
VHASPGGGGASGQGPLHAAPPPVELDVAPAPPEELVVAAPEPPEPPAADALALEVDESAVESDPPQFRAAIATNAMANGVRCPIDRSFEKEK